MVIFSMDIFTALLKLDDTSPFWFRRYHYHLDETDGKSVGQSFLVLTVTWLLM